MGNQSRRRRLSKLSNREWSLIIRELLINVFLRLTQSGVPNFVYTGVIIKYQDKLRSFTDVTKVFMAPLTDEEVEAYVDTGEPM